MTLGSRSVLLPGLLIALVALLIALLPKSASAHGSGHTSDYDNDGDQVILFYKGYDFANGFGQGIAELNNLHDMYPDHAPIWQRTYDRSAAEIIIRRTTLSEQNGNGCDNGMLFHDPGQDEIWLDNRDCVGLRKPMMHEGGHADGMYHHDCTDYWLNRSVMVTCSIRLDNWGSDDLEYAQTIVKGT